MVCSVVAAAAAAATADADTDDDDNNDDDDDDVADDEPVCADGAGIVLSTVKMYRINSDTIYYV